VHPWQLLSTRAGAFLLKGAGELVRVDDGSMKLVAQLEPELFFNVWPDGMHVLARGTSWFFSSDGGLSFMRTAGISGRSGGTFAGDRMFLYNDDGEAGWVDTKGTLTPLRLPVKASWANASFRDERNGVILGQCSVLLETHDAGLHWKVLPTPQAFFQRVRWEGADLILSDVKRSYRRSAGAAVFHRKSDDAVRVPEKDIPCGWSATRVQSFRVSRDGELTVGGSITTPTPDGTCAPLVHREEAARSILLWRCGARGRLLPGEHGPRRPAPPPRG
jgi:hypothetical protein